MTIYCIWSIWALCEVDNTLCYLCRMQRNKTRPSLSEVGIILCSKTTQNLEYLPGMHTIYYISRDLFGGGENPFLHPCCISKALLESSLDTFYDFGQVYSWFYWIFFLQIPINIYHRFTACYNSQFLSRECLWMISLL